jgi:hypothetical protein
MPPYKKVKNQTKNQKGKKSFSSKQKLDVEKNPKRTIGPALISEILDSRKIKIDGVEISKTAYENLQELVKSKGGIPIEQVIANLVEQNYNPKFKK